MKVLVLLFFAAWVFGVDSDVLVHNNDPDDSSTLYVMNSIGQMQRKDRGNLLKNHNNKFYFKNEKLNMYYDYKDNDWYTVEFEAQERSIKSAPFYIPVSACIDSGYGDGGSIENSYEATVTFTNSLEAATSYNYSNILLGANLGVEVGNSFSYSGSYSCSVSKGEYSQLMIKPFYVDVPKSTRRRAIYDKSEGMVIDGKHKEEVDTFKMIISQKPNHYCMTDTNPSNLKCADVIAGNQEIKI